MYAQRNLLRGVIAGVAGGLAASWVMNEFMSGPGKKLQRVVQDSLNDQRQSEQEGAKPGEKEDATMKTADAIVNVVTGGQHLSWEQKQQAGPVVHYAFGALMGGVYGGLAEYSSAVTSGLGTTFGGVLFGGADLLAVPVLGLSSAPSKGSAPALASPFAAHVVYGATTEIVRRIVRAIL
jgi:phage shock protein PspC (stress-responsive transcriptional regulator)